MTPRARLIWRLLGVAGLAGVAATGVVIARGERRRAALEPAQIRERLHQRYAEVESSGAVPTADPASVSDKGTSGEHMG